MPQLQKHVFVCTNHRENDPQSSCAAKGGKEIHKRLKEQLKAKGLSATMRANQSGCLGQCEKGCVMVIYPQGIWYQKVMPSDVDEIIEKSLLSNEVISRLRME